MEISVRINWSKMVLLWSNIDLDEKPAFVIFDVNTYNNTDVVLWILRI